MTQLVSGTAFPLRYSEALVVRRGRMGLRPRDGVKWAAPGFSELGPSLERSAENRKTPSLSSLWAQWLGSHFGETVSVCSGCCNKDARPDASDDGNVCPHSLEAGAQLLAGSVPLRPLPLACRRLPSPCVLRRFFLCALTAGSRLSRFMRPLLIWEGEPFEGPLFNVVISS